MLGLWIDLVNYADVNNESEEWRGNQNNLTSLQSLINLRASSMSSNKRLQSASFEMTRKWNANLHFSFLLRDLRLIKQQSAI